jgi:hypothetical protein
VSTKSPLTVNPALVESGVATVEEVRKSQMSSEMYRNPVMYDLFCGGEESGKIKYIHFFNISFSR